jgi:hypothetical protein
MMALRANKYLNFPTSAKRRVRASSDQVHRAAHFVQARLSLEPNDPLPLMSIAQLRCVN